MSDLQQKSDLLCPDQEILVSGTASSPSGLVLEQASAVIATVSADAIKIWPNGPLGAKHPKVWLRREDITFLETIRRNKGA